MQMVQSIRLVCGLECRVCLHSVDDGDRQEAAAVIALCGVTDDPYRVCPACFRDLTFDVETYEDEKFRQRVRMYYFNRGVVLRAASGRWQKVRLHDSSSGGNAQPFDVHRS